MYKNGYSISERYQDQEAGPNSPVCVPVGGNDYDYDRGDGGYAYNYDYDYDVGGGG